MRCKQCGGISQSGHEICNKKCRKAWMKEHPYKKNYRDESRIWGVGFDCDGNSIEDGRNPWDD